MVYYWTSHCHLLTMSANAFSLCRKFLEDIQISSILSILPSINFRMGVTRSSFLWNSALVGFNVSCTLDKCNPSKKLSASILVGLVLVVSLLTCGYLGGGIIDMMNRRLRERLTEGEILQIFVDVCEGVAAMHYLKPALLHRDLKVELVASSQQYCRGTHPL
jgi:serine/threonine protein kinase